MRLQHFLNGKTEKFLFEEKRKCFLGDEVDTLAEGNEKIDEKKFEKKIEILLKEENIHEEQRKELEDAMKKTQNKALRHRIRDFLQKKDTNELLDFFQSDTRGENISDWKDKILNTSAKIVVEEAREKLTKTEMRNPMRQYMQWLFKLSKESGVELKLQGFIREYFNAELIKRLPDKETKGMAQYLILWEDNRGKESEEMKSLQKRSLLEQEIDPTESEKRNSEINILLTKDITTFSKEEIMIILPVLSSIPSGKESRVYSFLEKNTPENFIYVEKIAGEKVMKKLHNIYSAHTQKNIDEIRISSASPRSDIGQKSKIYSQEGTVNEYALNEKEIQNEVERVDIENKKILKQLKNAGFSSAVIQKAENISDAQKKELSSSAEKSIDNKAERKRQQEFYELVQYEIREDLDAVNRAGAEIMLEEIERIEKKTEAFYSFVNNFFEKDLETQIEGRRKNGEEISETDKAKIQNEKNVIEYQARALFNRAKMLCKAAMSENDRQIIQEIHEFDLGENAEKAKNNRTLLLALDSYKEKQEEKRGKSNAIYKEKRTELWKFIKPYLEQEEKERFESAVGEMDEILEKTKMLAADIQEGISAGDFPEKNTYPEIKQWAEEWNVSESEAIQLVTTVLPVSEILFLDRKEVMKKALEEYGLNDKEICDLLEWYSKNSNEIAGEFARYKGTLKQMLIENAGKYALDANGLVQGAFLDGVQGKQIQEAQKEEKYQESKKEMEDIRKHVLPHAKKAKEVLEVFKEIEVKIPDTEETKSTRADHFRVRRKLEGIAQWEKNLQENAPEVSLMDKQSLLDDLDCITDFTEEIKNSENIGLALEKGLKSIEKYTQEMTILSPEEFVEKVKSPLSTDFTVQRENREKLREVRERNRKRKLDAFAQWVIGNESILSQIIEENENEEEKILQNVSIWSLMESLENLNGKKVLHKLSKEQWKKKKYEEEEKAIIVLQSGTFEIHVKEKEWESSDMTTSLRHEGFHALDIANDKKFGREMESELKKLDNFDFNSFRDAFCRATKTPAKKFSEEIFAYVLSEETDEEIQNILAKAPDGFFNKFITQKEEYAKNFSTKGIKQGFFSKKTEYARTIREDESKLPNNIKEHHKFELEVQINKFRRNIEGVRQSTAPSKNKEQFLESIEDAMEESIERARNLGNHPKQDAEFDEITKTMEELNDEVVSALNRLAEVEEQKQGFFHEVWDNTTFLSLSDLSVMWETGTEFIKRRHQRNSKLRAGKAGKIIFDKIAPSLANEYDNKAEEAEKEEVSNYENGLDNKDGWQIMERVAETRSKDELKACLNVLSQNGQIDWTDRRIWSALERVGSGIKILEADADSTNILKTKLQRSCAVLWDNDYFRETDRTNGGNFQSGKNNYEDEIKANVQGLGSMPASLLAQKRAGENVDPQRYEAYLEQCIKMGKSTPEEIFWLLIQGVHHGILNMERVNYFDTEVLNVYPPVEWFYDKRPSLEEVRQIAERFPPDGEKGGGMPWAFVDWFMSEVFANKNVRERVIKEGGSGEWDHDWATTMLAVGDVSTAQEALRMHEGGPRLRPTAYPNMLIGQLTYMTNMARYRERYSEDNLKDEVLRHLGFTAAYDSIVLGNVKDPIGQGYYTISDYALERSPRRSTTEQLYQSKKDITTKELITNNLDIISMIDPEKRFEFLKRNFDSDVKEIVKSFDNVKDKETGEPVLANEKITNGADLLEKLPKVFKALLDKHPDRLEMILNKASDVYKEHHPDADNNNKGRISDERAMNWREYAKGEDSIGKDLLNKSGMYNR